MTHKMRAGAIASALVLCSLASTAQADWTICNRTPEKMTVAIAYVNPAPKGGFISEGWWELQPCGGCTSVLSFSKTSDHGNLFFHAHGGGLVIGGDTRYCTTKKKFTIVGNQDCAKRGFEVKSFKHVTSKATKGGTHTTSLTGKSPSGKVCKD